MPEARAPMITLGPAEVDDVVSMLMSIQREPTRTCAYMHTKFCSDRDLCD